MNILKKIITILIIFVIIYTAIGFVIPFQSTTGASSKRSTYTSLDNSKYPGYNDLIKKLKSEHPNWNFTILYTGLDWNQVIKSESTGHWGSPKNLISASKSGEWICSICGETRYDNGSWCCASEKTIAYYMDPRNLLNNMDIFQLEEVKYNSSIHTLEGVKKMTSGTFLSGDSIGQALLTACSNANVSPYYVVARIKQEQGSGGSTTGKGMESDGKKYYNVFNVGASGNNKEEIIANALATAKANGWDTLEKSILGGIDFLKTKYVNRGQNTLYLNKFDVDDSDGTLYSHQYMQNIQAASNEAISVYKIYNETGKLNGSFNFIIPVYENMPNLTSQKPSDYTTNPKNVIVATQKDPLIVRSGPGKDYSEIARIAKGTVVLSIERESNQDGWDKVVLDNGKIGYVYSQYLEITDDVTNCNDTMVITGEVLLRSGPSVSNTSVITTLYNGQIVTRIDTNRYQNDGQKWDRIMLSDGRQGFVETKYLTAQSNADTVTVIANDGLRLRTGPSTQSTVIRTLQTGLVLTRLEKATTPGDGGYYWDKVITPTGVEGYVARDYIKDNNTSTSAQNNYKLDATKSEIIMEPKTTLKNLKDKGANVTKAINKDGNTINDGDLIGTGSKITVDGKEYVVVKLGDVNGDGKVTTIDAARVLKKAAGTYTLTDSNLLAADLNGDGKVTTVDAARVLKNAAGNYDISL